MWGHISYFHKTEAGFSTCSSYLPLSPSLISILLLSALPTSYFLWRRSPGQRSVQLWAPAQKKKKSPDTHFLRLFAFHMDGQLHFTGIILDGNILIIPVNCQRSTLSSIISVSFEFLLAASVHKFLKRYENNTDFFSGVSLMSNEIWRRLGRKEYLKLHCLFGFIYQKNTCPSRILLLYILHPGVIF